jgi:CBS domain-containing protein
VGTLLLSRAGDVPEARRASVRVATVMAPAADLPVLRPDDDLVDAARALSASLLRHGADVPRSSVVLGGGTGQEPVGVLSTTDLERALASAPMRVDQRG